MEETKQYKDLMMEYRNIFAWSYKNFKGIPPDIIQHTIPLIPHIRLICQRECHMNVRLQLVVKVELEKLLKAGFIKLIKLTN
jgi:hypothetical protein